MAGTKTITTVLVDDEGPALQRLAALVRSNSAFTIIAVYNSARDALDFLRHQPADLLLLDIEMPGMSGLELLNYLPEDKRPAVVFVTAYDEYAVQAFEYYAVDYILKPFTGERFEKMLHRVENHFQNSASNTVPWADVAASVEQGAIPGRITIKTGKRYHFIPVQDVVYIYANGNYCELYVTSGQKYLQRETISRMLLLLPAGKFARIHNSCIVSIYSVKQVKRLSFGELEIKVLDDTWLKVSRRYRAVIKQLVTGT